MRNILSSTASRFAISMPRPVGLHVGTNPTPLRKYNVAQFFLLCCMLVPFAGASHKALSADSLEIVGREADADWMEIDLAVQRSIPSYLINPPLLPVEQSAQATTWERIAKQSQEFQARFPDEARLTKARKIETMALLRMESIVGEAQKSANALRIEQYFSDKNIPEHDRCDLKALAKLLRADWSGIRTRLDETRMRAAHARELIQEYPTMPQGYGYMLSAAKLAPGNDGIELALQIIRYENAPDNYKSKAWQIIAQYELLYAPMHVGGLDLNRYLGRPLLIYTWTLKQPDVFSMLKVWSNIPGVQLLGINLDADPTMAKALVQTQTLPGDMVYDGGKNQGKLSAQLHFLTSNSIYLVDHEDKLVDVVGYENTLGKLAALAKTRHDKKGNAK